jgi:hypothetical protein
MGFDRENPELMAQLRKSGNLDDDSAGKAPVKPTPTLEKAVKVEKVEKKVDKKKTKKWGR